MVTATRTGTFIYEEEVILGCTKRCVTRVARLAKLEGLELA
jgi:hypothetical protein